MYLSGETTYSLYEPGPISLRVYRNAPQAHHLTISHQPGENCAPAISFLAISAGIASMTNIHNRLETCSLADLQMFDSFSNLDDHACTFVACTLSPELGHWWECPIMHHEVDIAHAESGRIKLDQNIFRSRFGNGYLLDLLKCNQSESFITESRKKVMDFGGEWSLQRGNRAPR